ncbi:hypothetical protein [Sphingobacterium sp.]|uniref:hypothetical protein n=1 Tax=Sphingobacterium sp. TaxID=341027 RepID=UPI002FDE46F2
MKRILLFIPAMVFIACGRLPEKFSTLAQGMQYVADKENGFVRDTLLPGGIGVSVKLLPAAMIQKTNSPGNQKYFSIQFSHEGHELLPAMPGDQYGAYVQLFSFGMDKYIQILDSSGKEYAAGMVTYQPTYGLGRSNELLAVFNEDLPADSRPTLMISEFGLGTGDLRFSFDADKLNYTPIIDQF